MVALDSAPVSHAVAWHWVLVVFLAATLGFRALVAMKGGEHGLRPPGHVATIEDLFEDGLAEALEQENTMVMRGVYVVVIAGLAIDLVSVDLTPEHHWHLRLACLTLLAWRAAAVASCMATCILDSLAAGRGEGRIHSMMERHKSFVAGQIASNRSHRVVSYGVTAMIYVVAAVFVLDNVGIEVKGLVSYMGFLGLALSLGAQYMLQDLLGYCALMLDGSIAVGDMVIVGSDPKGTVEAISYLSSTVRTLGGELLLYRNRSFAASGIMNCSRMPHRLVTVPFELAATTTPADLEVARKCARGVVEEMAATESEVAPDLGGSVRWSEYNMRFYAVWIDSLAGGDFRGVCYNLYFYLDGSASKPLENEVKTLIFVRLAKLLEEKGIRMQGALVAESLAGGRTAAAASACARAGAA